MNRNDQAIKQGTATQLSDAITHDHFILYGQPIVPVDSAEEGAGYMEILIRYLEEEKKLLPPGGFLEILESLNLMAALDRWVLNRVVRSLVGQHAAQNNWNVPRYSVNLSIDSLYDRDFCAIAADHFRRNRLPRGTVWFELAESDAHTHAAALKKLTSSLNPVGYGFTLTSYTGTLVPPASLQALGVSSVKIDCQSIGEAGDSAAAPAGARPAYLKCKDLGIRTIAEMVELPKTLESLKKLGIDYAQGFAVAPPAPLRPSTALS